MRDAVLVLSQRNDFGVDAVVDELTKRGERVFRFDLADLPESVLRAELSAAGAASGWNVTLSTRVHSVRLEDVKSIWLRHPSRMRPPEDLPWQVALFVQQEVQYAFAGLLASRECLFVNDPVRESVAHLKPFQLAAAARAGLRVPRSIITNDPEQLREFHGQCGEIICKSLTGVPATTTSGEIIEQSIPTTRVTGRDLDYADTLRLGPGFFQELLVTPFQVRVTAVGRELFAVRVDSGQTGPDAPVDWRFRSDLTYSRYSLPAAVEAQLVELLDDLALEFAGVDLVATDAGELCFLELNPRGQWGWLQAATDYPIAAAIAALLASGKPSRAG